MNLLSNPNINPKNGVAYKKTCTERSKGTVRKRTNFSNIIGPCIIISLSKITNRKHRQCPSSKNIFYVLNLRFAKNIWRLFVNYTIQVFTGSRSPTEFPQQWSFTRVVRLINLCIRAEKNSGEQYSRTVSHSTVLSLELFFWWQITLWFVFTETWNSQNSNISFFFFIFSSSLEIKKTNSCVNYIL